MIWTHDVVIDYEDTSGATRDPDTGKLTSVAAWTETYNGVGFLQRDVLKYSSRNMAPPIEASAIVYLPPRQTWLAKPPERGHRVTVTPRAAYNYHEQHVGRIVEIGHGREFLAGTPVYVRWDDEEGGNV